VSVEGDLGVLLRCQQQVKDSHLGDTGLIRDWRLTSGVRRNPHIGRPYQPPSRSCFCGIPHTRCKTCASSQSSLLYISSEAREQRSIFALFFLLPLKGEDGSPAHYPDDTHANLIRLIGNLSWVIRKSGVIVRTKGLR
jgi:hypothetical protein